MMRYRLGQQRKRERLLIIQARAHTVLAIMALGEWPVEENERPQPITGPQ